MSTTAITRQDLQRRRAALKDLQQDLASQERAFGELRGRVQEFLDRYTAALGPLYLELDALESQLHSTTQQLAEALRRSGILPAGTPKAPKATAIPQLPRLPAGAPLPPEPAGGLVDLAPPRLKTLYRRAAMRLHPDLADTERDRRQREQQMMAVNAAYADGDRATLASMLLAAGEDPVKVTGGNADAIRHWLVRSEVALQGRLRVVQAHMALLGSHSMHKLCQAITRAEAEGLDPLAVMASRLRSQIAERRQEVYIGQRLHAPSSLAQDFLRQRADRMNGAVVH